ncbi:AcrR family transcriptional regulator [Mycolicibacterium sp. BK556]|uniref:TetR/AcrR family transcriptional regulator n=1 Tax=unclassified Mycolicibacterium TaxID=2636767 RepID=UPI0016208F0F|nr:MULTISPECIES: TetR/AcrR family transcriptional regulator [unclassified Mycolicibacterium]MBB3603743.1 AcrR family transcriptional regulator [Mycolicibacterium sp. BK556]MBB3633938.1 AcrR family transcriptional regulator [Mycolicibacterium sp. BK607]MBB3751520.1 AcrR family transcriptional regulator [Mycolicibacterium sp. BK634]
MTQATSADTRYAIIMAAFACFRTHGLKKTTVVDICRQADISRSTFYEYFRDKETIVEACAESASQNFYRMLAKAIDRDGGSTLEGKLVRAAVFITQAHHVLEPEVYFDNEVVSVMLTKNAATLLQECSEFLAPYVSAARLTGEVRTDLDVTSATEWFARMLFSLFTTPSPHVDMSDDEAVADFVRPYVVRGFVDERPRRRSTAGG